MNLAALSLFGFTVGMALMVLLVLSKRHDEVALHFFLFGVSVTGWSAICFLLISQSFSYEWSLFFARSCNAFSVFIPITWTHFVFKFIRKNEPFKYFYLLFYAFSFCMSALSFTPQFILGLHSVGKFRFYTSPGPFYHMFTIIFVTLVPYAFYHLMKAYKKSEGQERLKLRYFIISTIIAFVSGSTTFFPVYGIAFPLDFLSLMLVYPFFMGVALIRYGLFDVQQIADAFQREKLAALGTMAASLNHELRNPLYIAHGRIDSYLHSKKEIEAEVPSKVREILESAHRQLGRALEIMQRFTDFARPIPRQGSIEKVVIEHTVRDVMDLISNELETRNIQVNTAGLDGQWIQGNKRQVEEIFFNLMLNACQAMGATGGEIGIVAKEKGNKLVVEVADNGPGMAPDQAEAIFEPFYSTKGEKGSGLGLYITKQLVERNGGKISVKSAPDKGTIFIISFPKL